MTSQTPVLAAVSENLFYSKPQAARTVEKTKILLFLADVYGSLYINNQLLQGYFASQGFIVMGVDYFLGDTVYIHTEPGFDRPALAGKVEVASQRTNTGMVECYS
ncbi:hypothetical protein IW262DRAFT_1454701 [Armillaria fumosa]|nr:hypothetical protein IW262DRAFT_1454701 [Armillaria fumosa]